MSNLSLTGDGYRMSGDRGGHQRFEPVENVVTGEILRRFPPRRLGIRSDLSLVEFVRRDIAMFEGAELRQSRVPGQHLTIVTAQTFGDVEKDPFAVLEFTAQTCDPRGGGSYRRSTRQQATKREGPTSTPRWTQRTRISRGRCAG
jgi:hypothetical protein